MDKVGGLDEYLLGGGAARVKELGLEGWRLRWAVVNRLAGQRRGREDPRVVTVMNGMKEFAAARDTEEIMVAQASPRATQRGTSAADSVEDRIERRLQEQRARFMREEVVAPVSLWQRMRRMVGLS